MSSCQASTPPSAHQDCADSDGLSECSAASTSPNTVNPLGNRDWGSLSRHLASVPDSFSRRQHSPYEPVTEIDEHTEVLRETNPFRILQQSRGEGFSRQGSRARSPDPTHIARCLPPAFTVTRALNQGTCAGASEAVRSLYRTEPVYDTQGFQQVPLDDNDLDHDCWWLRSYQPDTSSRPPPFRGSTACGSPPETSLYRHIPPATDSPTLQQWPPEYTDRQLFQTPTNAESKADRRSCFGISSTNKRRAGEVWQKVCESSEIAGRALAAVCDGLG